MEEGAPIHTAALCVVVLFPRIAPLPARNAR
jgi:hypothetical protein